MPANVKIISILKSAELVFELGIINPTRFGPLIHANIPDYAEILMKVFVEDNKIAVADNNFWGHITAIRGNPIGISLADFNRITEYFNNTRNTFRNPLHHYHQVQGYVIERSEALNCLLMFDELLRALFPAITIADLGDANYPCYLRFLKMEFDENRGRGNHQLYQAVINKLNELEARDILNCPHDFDAARLMAIRRLFHYDDEKFFVEVLGFRSGLMKKIIDILPNGGRGLTQGQIQRQLEMDNDFRGTGRRELEGCLQYIPGEIFVPKGRVMVMNGSFYLAV